MKYNTSFDKSKNIYVVETISLNKHARMGYVENKPETAILVYKEDGEFFDYNTDKWIQDYMIERVITLDKGKDIYPELFL